MESCGIKCQRWQVTSPTTTKFISHSTATINQTLYTGTQCLNRCRLSSVPTLQMGHTFPFSYTMANRWSLPLIASLPLTASLSLESNQTKHLTFSGTDKSHKAFHLSESWPPKYEPSKRLARVPTGLRKSPNDPVTPIFKEEHPFNSIQKMLPNLHFPVKHSSP